MTIGRSIICDVNAGECTLLVRRDGEPYDYIGRWRIRFKAVMG